MNNNKQGKRSIILSIIFIGLTIQVIYIWQGCKSDKEKLEIETAKVSDPLEPIPSSSYLGSESCKSCHEKEYNDWENSDHDLAMQRATPEFVKGDFEDKVFVSQGVTSKFFRKNDKYFVHTEGPNGIYSDFEIKFTYGIKPLQQYLVEFPGGKLQCLRTAWDSNENKWFDLYPHFPVHPKEWLHWTKGGLNWNTMCSDCHSTNVRKNYFEEADSFATTYSLINISCESCHGPGKQHVEYVNSNKTKTGDPYDAGKHLFQISTLSPKDQVDQCARCHSRREQFTPAYNHQGEFMDHYVPSLLRDDLYHPDGQIKEEVYEYASFTQSKMYMNGVKCSNCHNPHSLKLVEIGNALCGQCHDSKKYDVPSHHFHTVDTEGAKCVNCHMTGETYMGNDFRRDHSFRVPRPDQSVQFNTPNACNECHLDKSAKWAANAVEKWYGKDRQPHFSDALALASTRSPASVAGLINLMKDAKQPPIVKATALWYLGQLPGSQESISVIINALSDPEPIVRYTAIKELTPLPVEQTQNYILPMLKDKILSVRVAAAMALAPLPEDKIPAELTAYYQKAKKELEISMKEKGDFPGGQLEAGQYYERKGDLKKAEKAYKASIAIDSLFNPARLNLAYLYNRQQNNAEAIALLKLVLRQEPEYAAGYYSLGLLYAEEEKMDLAIEYLRKATEKDETNARALYNLGLALQKVNKTKEAEAIYLKGIKQDPDSFDFRNALAIMYIQNKEFEKALKHLTHLQEKYPNNPQVLQLSEYIRMNQQ